MWELVIGPLRQETTEVLAWLESYPFLALTIGDAGKKPVFSGQEAFAASNITALMDDADVLEPADRYDMEIQLRLLLAALAEPGADVQWRCVVEENWQESWKSHCHPIEVRDSLVVLPTWLDPLPEWQHRQMIRIDPEMAFGTGSHETTFGCLDALVNLAKQRSPYGLGSVLDIGTGSGILAIAALHLGASRVVATEIDPIAVETCYKNIQINGYAPPSFSCEYRPDLPAGPFDVVVGNLLMDVIVDFLSPAAGRSLVEVMAPGGEVILSGLLIEQVDLVQQACSNAGLQEIHVIQWQDWAVVTATKMAEGV